MAPMTRGTDLPFRLLAAEWGAAVCTGEMAYAHRTGGRDRGDLPLLRRHPAETIFGVQLAGKIPDVMAEAARVAEGQGADFVDINLGCPIDEVTRRGFGASLLQRPSKVAAIVAAMKAAVTIPVTIKLRLGWSEGENAYLKVARAAVGAGVDAIALHARSRAQRYRRPAVWEHVKALVAEVTVPVIGNGDIFTWREAKRRMEETGCAAVMVGRGAREALDLPRVRRAARHRAPPTNASRWSGVVELCRVLRDDEKGRAPRFLVFHQDFFRRYRRARLRTAAAPTTRAPGKPPQRPRGWLCRPISGVTALARWLVDGEVVDLLRRSGCGARRKAAALG
jgi:tRNA-dihydrouridine synthase